MWTYLLAGQTGTIHVDRACRSASRSSSLVEVQSPNPPELVWDVLWHNHTIEYQTAASPYGTEPDVPPMGDTDPPVDQSGYGVKRWGCLHCLEQAAIDRGWSNTWPPDPRRRHR